MIEIQKTRITQTQYGPVEGVHGQNPSFTVFKGIPFAAPPVGDLRFCPPTPPKPWTEPLPCFRYAAAPIQSHWKKGGLYQVEFYPVDRDISEDCLYLNVWTPALTDTERCPVMVWYHGGGFGGGSADEITFDGEAFARRGVILVTVGYRINVFSAFASIKDGLYGNCGSRDQLAALKWVNDNIRNFGGDPTNITIFGQSAGGAGVQSLMASPLARGLFQKAIVQSAGGVHSLGGYRSIEMADRDSKRMMDNAGIASVEQLRALSADELHAVFSQKGFNCYPTVDGDFLLDSPGNCMQKGEIADVPYMTGTVPGDPFFATAKPQETYEEQVQAIRDFYPEKTANAILEKFLPDESCFEEFVTTLKWIKCVGSPEAFAKSRMKYSDKPVYLYHFDRLAPEPDEIPAFHSFELWYVFGTLMNCHRHFKGVDFELSNMFTDYWCAFATTGDPNNTKWEQPTWTPYTKDSPTTLRINDKVVEPMRHSDNAMVDFFTEPTTVIMEK